MPPAPAVPVVVVMALMNWISDSAAKLTVELKILPVVVNCAPTIASGWPVPAQAAFALTPAMTALKSPTEALLASETGLVPDGPVKTASAAE